METFHINGFTLSLTFQDAVSYRTENWINRGYEVKIQTNRNRIPLGSSLLKIDDYDKTIEFYYCSELSFIIDAFKSMIINNPKQYGFRSANQSIMYYHNILLPSYLNQ